MSQAWETFLFYTGSVIYTRSVELPEIWGITRRSGELLGALSVRLGGKEDSATEVEDINNMVSRTSP